MRPPYPDRDGRPDDGDVFELQRLWQFAGFVLRAPLRHRRLALAAFLTSAVLGFVALAVVPKQWEVSASLLAQRSALMSSLSNPGMNREWDAPTRAARELVIRRDNLVALCKQISFVDRYLATRAPAVRLRDWVFTKLRGREKTSEEVLDGLVDALEARLWLTVGAEGTVNIGFAWSDREIALQVVQAAIQSFMEGRYAADIKMVGETIAILEEHDAQLQKDIATTIRQVEEKQRNLRISRTERLPVIRTPPPPDEDLARLEATLVARRRALVDLEEFRRQRLQELQAQLQQQLGTYAPEHPLVAATRRGIESASGPSPQIEVLRLEIGDLEKQVRRKGGRADPGTLLAASASAEWAQAARLRMDAEDPRLEFERRQLDLLLRQHTQLTERIDSARIEMDTARAAFKYKYSVVTPPQLPRVPKKPYALLFGGGGIAGGIALALFLSAVGDLRRGRVVERWQVEHELGIPVLAERNKSRERSGPA